MAHTNIEQHSAGFGLSAWIDRAKSHLRVMRARQAAYDQTYRELSYLSDRELSDIGLSRADIVTTARQAAAMA